MTDVTNIGRSLRWKVLALGSIAMLTVGAIFVVAAPRLDRVADSAEQTAYVAETHRIVVDLGDTLVNLEEAVAAYGGQPSVANGVELEAALGELDADIDDLRGQTSTQFAQADITRPIVGAASEAASEVEAMLTPAGATNLSERVLTASDSLRSITELQSQAQERSLEFVQDSSLEQAATAQTMRTRAFAAGLAVLVVVVGLVTVFARLSRAVADITRTASAIAHGDLKRMATTNRRDELGQLADAFNSMTGQLRKSLDSLEQRVEERTLELSEANARLEAEVMERNAAETLARSHAEELELTIAELGSTRDQLRQAQKLEAIGGLASGVAYEINTPIQYIGDNVRFLGDSVETMLELVRSFDDMLTAAGTSLEPQLQEAHRTALKAADVEFLEGEVPAAIRETVQGARSVGEILNGLREFTQLDGDLTSLIDLNDVVKHTVTVSSHQWKYVSDLNMDLDLGMAMVEGKPGPLGQALLILIENAAHAMADVVGNGGDRGTLTVSTHREDGGVSLIVGDTGGGIPVEVADRVFEPRFSTKKSRSSGQDLSVAREIVADQHGGTISFDSKPGEGTEFRVFIPTRAGLVPDLDDSEPEIEAGWAKAG